MLKNAYLQRVYDTVLQRDPNEPEFLQAVTEVLESLECLMEKHPEYEAACLHGCFQIVASQHHAPHRTQRL